MKNGVVPILLVLALAACGQTAPSVNKAKPNYPAQNFAASTDTQAKTSVKNWNFQGAETGVTVTGADAGSKGVHTLSISVADAKTFKVARAFKGAAGETVASLELLLKNDGSVTSSKTGNPFDAALCPDCMESDFVGANPGINQLTPQLAAPTPIETLPPVIIADPTDVTLVTTQCNKALKNLTAAAMTLSRICGSSPNSLNCAIATAGYWFIYQQQVVPACGPVLGPSL